MAQALVSGIPNTDVTQYTAWSSLNPSIASISSTGLITGVAPGTAQIQGQAGGFSTIVSIGVGGAPLISQIGMSGCPLACALPTGTTSGYSFTFSASGGLSPYTWAINASTSTCLSGSGLSLTGGGVLSGVTPVAGTYTCLYQLTDTQPVTTTLSVAVTIAPSSVCGPPNFNCSNATNLVIPPPATPNLSTGCTVGGQSASCNNNATVFDTSYSTPAYGGTPSANLSPITRCTDARSAVDNLNAAFTAGTGSSGVFENVNANSTIAGITVLGGQHYFTQLSGGACVAPTGAPANSMFFTKAMNSVNPGSNSSTEDFGGGSFDATNPLLWWSGNTGSDIIVPTQVLKYTFTLGATPRFTYSHSGTAAVADLDFVNGLPLGTNAPEWSAATGTYSFGAYVTHTLGAPGSTFPEYSLLAASTTYNIGDVIVPGTAGDGNTTNPQGCMFKMSAGVPSTATSGISAVTHNSSTPDFGSKNPCVLASVTDGTVVWKGIAATNKFVYQNTGATGAPNGSAFRWIPVGGHPNMLSTVNDAHGIVWANSGPNYIPTMASTAWDAWGGVSIDNTKINIAFSTNTYGGSACGKTNCYSPYAAGQGTGIWASESNSSDPVTGKPTYYLLNTGTGIQTNWTCGAGTLQTCSSITASTPGVAYPVIVNANNAGLNCSFFLHNSKPLSSGIGQIVVNQVVTNSANGTACNAIQSTLMWMPTGTANDGTYNANTGLQATSDGMNHWTTGFNHVVAFHNGGYGQSSGVMVDYLLGTNVSGNNGVLPVGTGCVNVGGTTCTPPYVFSIAGNCSNSINAININYPSNGIALNNFGQLPAGTFHNAGDTPPGNGPGNPPCNLALAYDSHLNWNYNPGGADGGAITGTIFNYATMSPIPFAAWQNEEVVYPIGTPAASCLPGSGCPVAVGSIRRQSHTFSTGTNPFFAIQFEISQGFMDGTGIMWTSDWNCTLGSLGIQKFSLTGTGVPVQDGSGALGHLPVTSNPVGALSFCGTVWQPNFPYVLGTTINPILGTAGGGVQYDVFQAVLVNGSSSSCTTVAGACGTASPNTSAGFFATATKTQTPTATMTVTAASESGTSATITTSYNCGTTNNAACATVGQSINVSGMTPSGYNCTSCVISAVVIGPNAKYTYTLPTSGLGIGTVFGSAYGIGGKYCDSGTQADTLPTCAHGTVWQDAGTNNARGDVFYVSTR